MPVAAADPLALANMAGSVWLSNTDDPGDLISQPGDLQFGRLLIPASLGAEVTGWRDTPDTATTDTDRPQNHGSIPGQVYASEAVIALTFRVPGPPLVSATVHSATLRAVEAATGLDSVDRPLVFHDGDVTVRTGRVLQRHLPRPWNFGYTKRLECALQWVCADPHRYDLDPTQVVVNVPTSTGGLAYPLTYPLNYGSSRSGAATVLNDGSAAAASQIVFLGPLVSPWLIADCGWQLGFDLTLADGESLVVDVDAGIALLNGVTDRMYTIATASTPVERCLLPRGTTGLVLATAGGTGRAVVTYRSAYL